MKQYQHIIWDFNGTLFDDFELSFLVLEELLVKTGMPLIDRATYKRLFCHPLIEFYRKIGFRGSKSEFAELSTYWHKLYELRLGECELHAYSREMLKWCRDQGLSQSILSALPEFLLKALVEKHSIGSFFSDIRGASDFIADGKVEAAKRWIKETKMKPEEIVLIGDTNHDAEVASALGVSCILLAQGFQARSVLEPCGYRIFDTIEDLFRYVSSSASLACCPKPVF